MKKIIELKNITKSFDGETVLDDISLDIYDNEFLTLLGPSGCGKTTTLRLIGGFETADKGDIIFMGENINDVPPYKRNVNTVFQRYALFPHLNVFENIAFPLREKKVDRDEIEEKVEEMLSLVALKGFEHRSVTSLSGGQQQRVAIARALVSRPKVLLLDEPLAALDLKLRKDMQQELKKIQKATGITFVFVTHDQEEALSMSDTVVVMSEGRISRSARLSISTTSRPTPSSPTSSARATSSTASCSRTERSLSPATPLTALTPASASASRSMSSCVRRTWTSFPRKKACCAAS